MSACGWSRRHCSLHMTCVTANDRQDPLFTMSDNTPASQRETRANSNSVFMDEVCNGDARSAGWWSQSGLNRRPHACKARALPAELWPQFRCGPPSLKLRRDSLRMRSACRAEAPLERRLVGLGRLELPTSRLSSARSNQLSYKPKLLT